MNPLDVYILGAGAWHVHGAPLNDDLLPYALTIPRLKADARLQLVREFLREVFHFDAPRRPRDPAWSEVPGLVDVLSMVDMALDRKENLSRGFSLERLRLVRSALEPGETELRAILREGARHPSWSRLRRLARSAFCPRGASAETGEARREGSVTTSARRLRTRSFSPRRRVQ